MTYIALYRSDDTGSWNCERAYYGPNRPPLGGPFRWVKNNPPKMRSLISLTSFLLPPPSIFYIQSILFILIYLIDFLILNFDFDFNSFEFSCLNLFRLKEKL